MEIAVVTVLMAVSALPLVWMLHGNASFAKPGVAGQRNWVSVDTRYQGADRSAVQAPPHFSTQKP